MQTPELTPRDDVKKLVSEVLKRVDTLIRKGDLEQAERCVEQAREIDPKNIYAYAFEERIHLLKEQAQENSIAAAVCKASEEKRRLEGEETRKIAVAALKDAQQPQPITVQAASKQTPIPIQPNVQIPHESTPNPPPPDSKIQQRSVQSPAVLAPTVQQTQPDLLKNVEEDRDLKIQRMIKIAVDAVRKEVEEKQSTIRAKEREDILRNEHVKLAEAAETARRAEEGRQIEIRKRDEERLLQKIKLEYEQRIGQTAVNRSTEQTSGTEQQQFVSQQDRTPTDSERLETLSRYKLVLSSVWADGAICAEEEATLRELRHSFSISDEEHARLEKEVKRETYIEAFKNAWNSGTITPENVSVLAELRERFQISGEEHLQIESTLLWEIQPVKNRPTLLVVDDDERLLSVVSKTLNEAGFITRSVTTSDEAYAYLRESAPDLILCDVNLETSTMGGFAFYEKVRELDQLRETPFIFLSGLTDEALVRTGKELGVDDYLSKPVSEETLVATIRGKLRRYQELKKRMN